MTTYLTEIKRKLYIIRIQCGESIYLQARKIVATKQCVMPFTCVSHYTVSDRSVWQLLAVMVRSEQYFSTVLDNNPDRIS